MIRNLIAEAAELRILGHTQIAKDLLAKAASIERKDARKNFGLSELSEFSQWRLECRMFGQVKQYKCFLGAADKPVFASTPELAIKAAIESMAEK